MPKCPDTIFEASGTAKDKATAESNALANARKQCEISAPGCPFVELTGREEHHDPKLGWTIALEFKCQPGP